MSALRRRPGMSNAEISRATKLAPQTVSLIVNSLTSLGLLEEAEPIRGKRGQPARPRLIRADGAYSFGCEISWKHVEIVLLDLAGTVIRSYHSDHDYPDASLLIDEIANVISQMRQTISEAQQSRIRGLGVAMPTEIWETLHRLDPPQDIIEGWRETNVVEKFEQLTGLKTELINDGSAACRAEQSFGVGSGYPDLAYFFISYFINGGLVIANKIFNGPTGNSGNLGGILVLSRTGRSEYVHMIASLFALENRYLEEDERRPDPNDIDGWVRPEVDTWVEEASHALALAIANCGAVVESPVAIIDGLFPHTIRDRLVARTSEIIKQLPNTIFEPPIILAGKVGHSAPAIGAADTPIYLRYFATEKT